MKARLIAITLFFSALFCAAPLYGQISVSLKDVPLTEALSTLETKSEYSFFYSNMLPGKDALVSIEAKDKSIEFILDNIFKALPISYEINGHQIVLSEEKKESKSTPLKVSGVVLDSTGEPVIGAGILIEGSEGGQLQMPTGIGNSSFPPLIRSSTSAASATKKELLRQVPQQQKTSRSLKTAR